MKKVFFAVMAIAAALTACKKDDPIRDNESPIYIWGKSAPNKAQAMSVHDILTSKNDTTAVVLLYHSPNDGQGGKACDVDTIHDRLVMEAGNIINNGQLGYAFLNGRNYMITLECQTQHTSRVDTVGYIPNAVWRGLTYTIDSLWHVGNVDEIYRLFNSAFYFYPCTGEEFKSIEEVIDWDEVGITDFRDRPRWLPKYEKK